MQQKDTSDTSPEKTLDRRLVWFTVLVAAIAFFTYLLLGRKRPAKVWKHELFRLYGVDKKTFSKWVNLFCADIIEYTEYKTARKLPVHIAEAIKTRQE